MACILNIKYCSRSCGCSNCKYFQSNTASKLSEEEIKWIDNFFGNVFVPLHFNIINSFVKDDKKKILYIHTQLSAQHNLVILKDFIPDNYLIDENIKRINTQNLADNVDYLFSLGEHEIDEQELLNGFAPVITISKP